MPELVTNNHPNNQNQYADLFNLLLSEIGDSYPVTLKMTVHEKQKALVDAEEYLIKRNKKIEELSFFSIYTIISKLSEEEQIKFFKENIDYISKNDEAIFIYSMMSPQCLSYFLSFNTIKELYKLDKNIVNKMIDGTFENFIYGFSDDEIIEMYDLFFEQFNNLENNKFISTLSYCNFRGNRIEDIVEHYKSILNFKNDLINKVYKKYKTKIDSFSPKELSHFIYEIDDLKFFSEVVKENKSKLSFLLQNGSKEELDEIFSFGSEKQCVLYSGFFDNIIKNPNLKDYLYIIDTNAILIKYSLDKEINLSLNDIIKSSADHKIFNNELKDLLDKYNIKNIKDLFDDKFFYNNGYFGKDIRALKYIENKYRNNITLYGNLFDIDENISIYSYEYLKNLKEIKLLLKSKTINKDSLIYQKHYKIFVQYLKNIGFLNELNEEFIKEIEILFYRIVMGHSLTVLYTTRDKKQIALYNRLGKIDFDSSPFTIQQLKRYSVKDHKNLCKLINQEKIQQFQYKSYILKLMLLVGYKHAEEILKMNSDITVLEHLVGIIDVTNIKLDEQGKPILNKKIINLLFNDKDKVRIKEMFDNKNGELYKFFPRIFNEWEAIKEANKDKSLSSVIEVLKSDSVILSKQYYRLNGLLKHIGCSNTIVSETLQLHDKILERTETTIPKVEGSVNEYSYEIIDLHNMEGLTFGNRTSCCFTVMGASYTSLKHAYTSKNGRILVIKKNDELIAHSWIWRNGNTLCLDNIEVAKNIKEIDFLDVYLDFADKLIEKSIEAEGTDAIENITIGHTTFDKIIKGIENYPVLKLGNIQMPQPLEASYEKLYTDSKKMQYLIKGNGIFKFGQSDYLYKEDEKQKVLKIS